MTVSGPQRVVSQSERKELQILFDRCVRLASARPYNTIQVDAMLRQCVARDPGNHIYVEAYLQNLEQKAEQAGSKRPSWFRRRVLRSAVRKLRWQEVLAIGLMISSRCPRDAEASHSLGIAVWQCELEESALCFLRYAARLQPTADSINRSLADVLVRTGRFDEALPRWRIVSGEDAERITGLLESPQPSPDQAAQLAAFKRGELDKPDVTSGLQLAERMLDEGVLDGAAELAQWALTISPGHQPTYFLLEEIRIRQSYAQMEIARRLAEEQFVSAELVDRFADNLARVEVEVLGNRQQKNPHDVQISFALGQRLKAVGNFAEALEPLEKSHLSAPLALQSAVELGECCQHLYRFEDARRWYEKALGHSPSGESDESRDLLYRATYRLAVLDLADGYLDKAEQLFRGLPENFRQTGDHLDKINGIRDKGKFPAAGGSGQV